MRGHRVSAGDDVFGRGQNTQAEYAVLDAWAAKPPPIDWAVAAAASVAGETSERALRLLGVNAGDTIFVDGGAGGVGATGPPTAAARPHQRRHPPEPGRPRNTYVSEDQILPHLAALAIVLAGDQAQDDDGIMQVTAPAEVAGLIG